MPNNPNTEAPITSFTLNELIALSGEPQYREGLLNGCIAVNSSSQMQLFRFPCRIDAFIIGDLGAAAIARRVAPRVALHVSTQASVANSEAARVWYSLGASRVVCAREMSLVDIARMREDMPADMEIEAFVHGAMCMAYSGRCMMSAFLTGRSANRGACAT